MAGSAALKACEEATGGVGRVGCAQVARAVALDVPWMVAGPTASIPGCGRAVGQGVEGLWSRSFVLEGKLAGLIRSAPIAPGTGPDITVAAGFVALNAQERFLSGIVAPPCVVRMVGYCANLGRGGS